MDERGVDTDEYDDLLVCPECIGDPDLQQFVRENATSDHCDFCETDECPSVSILDLVNEIKACLKNEYGRAIEELPYATAEGGYIGTTWNVDELLFDDLLELPRDEDGKLREAILGAIGDDVRCDAFAFHVNPNEQLTTSWSRFKALVRDRRRFFFLKETARNADELGPEEMLEYISSVVERLDLYCPFPADTPLYRVRAQKHPGEFRAPADLAAPKPEWVARANRMSPPGIVMTYCAEDVETCLAETAHAPGSYACADVRSDRSLLLLDLYNIPEVPGFFNRRADMKYEILFLQHFAEDLAASVDHEARGHIDYVPTQIITEYFRSRYATVEGPLDGIRYRSAKRPGHASLVLFATRENFRDVPDEPFGDKYLRVAAVGDAVASFTFTLPDVLDPVTI